MVHYTGDGLETLTFTTCRLPFVYEENPNVPLEADMVVAVDAINLDRYLVQERYAMLPGSAQESTWRLTVSLDAAERLLWLYDQTMVSQKAAGKYECHTLPSVVCGGRQVIGRGQGVGYAIGEPMPPVNLEACAPYAMTVGGFVVSHSCLGMGSEYPRHCLNILGGNGIWGITRILQTMDTFETQYLTPIRYAGSLYRSSL